MLSLSFVHDNFVRMHKTLRMSPAIVAGVSNTRHDMEWIVGLIDARAPAPKKRGPYKKRQAGHYKPRPCLPFIPYDGRYAGLLMASLCEPLSWAVCILRRNIRQRVDSVRSHVRQHDSLFRYSCQWFCVINRSLRGLDHGYVCSDRLRFSSLDGTGRHSGDDLPCSEKGKYQWRDDNQGPHRHDPTPLDSGIGNEACRTDGQGAGFSAGEQQG